MGDSDHDFDTIVCNLHRNYSGVTRTIHNTLKYQLGMLPVTVWGEDCGLGEQHISFREIISRYAGSSRKLIIHTRRNNEIFLSLVLKYLFRVRAGIVFTSASQRRHSYVPRLLISACDTVIATSQGAARRLSNTSRIIMHGIDTDLFSPNAASEDERDSFIRQYGLQGSRLVLTTGRVRPQKGTDIFVRAMIQACRKNPGLCALIVGLASRPSHRRWQAKIEQTIAAAALSSRIKFTGEVPAGDLPKYYRAADVCVICPRREEFGLTPWESLASGTPVVLSSLQCFQETAAAHLPVHPYLRFTNIGDTSAICRAALALLTVPNHNPAQCHQYMSKNFSARNEAAQITSIYTQTAQST